MKYSWAWDNDVMFYFFSYTQTLGVNLFKKKKNPAIQNSVFQNTTAVTLSNNCFNHYWNRRCTEVARSVEQKSLYMNPQTNYSTCLNILRENRQTYVSKTANTNRMTKKRMLSATTATWSMLPSVFWSRTSLPAATQKNYLNCTLSFFLYHHILQTVIIPVVF